MDGAYANVSSHEGTVSGSITIPLKFRARRISITNDSLSAELKFKFKESDDYSTLKSTEQISLNLWARTVILQGQSVPYRVLGIG